MFRHSQSCVFYLIKKTHYTAKAIAFQSSAANFKQLYPANEALFIESDKHAGGFLQPLWSYRNARPIDFINLLFLPSYFPTPLHFLQKIQVGLLVCIWRILEIDFIVFSNRGKWDLSPHQKLLILAKVITGQRSDYPRMTIFQTSNLTSTFFEQSSWNVQNIF